MNKILIALFVIIAITSTQANKQANNPFECATDVLSLLPEFQSLVNDVQTQNMPKVLNDIKSLVQAFPNVAADCGFSLSSKNTKNSMTCYEDLEKIVGIVQKISQNPTDINEDVTELEDLFQILQNVQADCTSASSFISLYSEEFLPESFF